MKKQTESTAKAIELIANEENGPKISRQAFHKAMKAAGVKPVGKRWVMAEVYEARAASRAVGFGASTGATADLKRDKLRLEIEILHRKSKRESGELIDRAAVNAEWTAVGTTIRSRLEMIPGSVAPLLVGQPAGKIAAILSENIREALAFLSGNPP